MGQGLPDAGDRASVGDPAFPHSDDHPAFAAQNGVDAPVPLAVACYFGSPIADVALRRLVAARAAVPEAAVHEESNLPLRPAEIGRAGDRVMPAPSCKPVHPKQRRHLRFGAAVPARPHGGHVARTSCPIDGIQCANFPAAVTVSLSQSTDSTYGSRHIVTSLRPTCPCQRRWHTQGLSATCFPIGDHAAGTPEGAAFL